MYYLFKIVFPVVFFLLITSVDAQIISKNDGFDISKRFQKKASVKSLKTENTNGVSALHIVAKDVLRDDKGQPILPIEIQSKGILNEPKKLKD